MEYMIVTTDQANIDRNQRTARLAAQKLPELKNRDSKQRFLKALYEGKLPKSKEPKTDGFMFGHMRTEKQG